MTEQQDDDTPATSGAEKTGGGGGESEGGAYPNPHTGHPKKIGGFFGHGGQSDIAYSGTGVDPGVGNANAPTEGE